MSFSVDDLVSSLSSSHIGQEAMDLAALQAQLAATLFCAHGPSSTSSNQKSRSSYACPSPMRTPSTSFSSMSMSQTTPVASRRGSCSVVAPSGTPRAMASPLPSYHYNQHYTTPAFEDAMDEDERMMVEELLIPSSPAASAPSHLPYHHHQQYHTPSSPVTTSSFFTSAPVTQQLPQSQVSVNSNAHLHPQYQSLDQPSQSTSLFASTDPFYLAQLQASQQSPATSQSVFSQNGRMAPGSRFALSMHAQAAW